jgi:putative molybdopterin biosynthesis protein
MNKPETPISGLEQEQFLTILSREAAIAAFETALDPRPLGAETLPLAALLGRVLANDIHAPVDAPPFDRSVVDGFAVRSADLGPASAATPVTLTLNAEVIACGKPPRIALEPGTATAIATGGPLPRGADAVVMIEHTDPVPGGIAVAKPAAPGQNIAFAGSDIARGQAVLYRGGVIGSREIAMLAAVGIGEAPVWRKPRVAVLSTGDELVAAGAALPEAGIYDSNGPIVVAALRENGCEPVALGIVPDDEAQLEASLRAALADCDAVILSGGTSKGAGDYTQRAVSRLGRPGIVAHGVALKPGKPLCLAVCDGKPVVVLPGFPTSAMFTFHDIVVPALRALAGLPPREDSDVAARVPVTIPSELGRTEFVMVALARDGDDLVAHPVGKGSGAVTAFGQADGFLRIEALADRMPAGTVAPVRLFNAKLKLPDLVIMGSHCVGLDAVIGTLAGEGLSARVLALGSLGGLGALKRGECDLAPIHLLDEASGIYNRAFLGADMALIPGWRRLQGLVYRPGDARFEGRTLAEAVAAALADPACILVNRNQGAGTRTLVDALLKGARPPGYWNQPRSHNAVAVAVAQGRADWGIAIHPVADALGLGFIPLADEHYDFAVRASPRDPARIEAFRRAIAGSAEALRALGFERD